MTVAALLLALIATPNAETSRAPVLLDFHADWCGPCQKMRPAVDQLVQKGFPIRSINIDDSPELAERYRVSSIPTFIVVDGSGRTLARTQGYQPAAELASFYRAAKSKVAAAAPADADDAQEENDASSAPAQDAEAPAQARPAAVNPKPWETVVRIKVHGNGTIGFGSGTIIHSTAEESIILTCAHIFKMEGRQQAPPSRFPLRIDIDLFDGKLRGLKPAQVHCIETVEGEAMDYDFTRDVGLIRIRPGRRLPASRVVPANWTPQSGMKMTTVGCSEGHDATAWSTAIVRPTIRGLTGSPSYEAIECVHAPKQGRSGGGLYTIDGYVAGVCDFAEPHGNHGLYASPRSIRAILDRNQLTALYVPGDRQNGRLVAETRPAPKRKPPSIARAQSPDTEEPESVRIPPPELLGIKEPRVARNGSGRERARGRKSWRASPNSSSPTSSDDDELAERTDLKLSPQANNDGFDPTPSEPKPPSEVPTKPRARSRWRPVENSPSAVATTEER